jgi:glycosyltransferase involved in cell wall biosynthesis
MKIIIDPRIRINYASYYLYGIFEKFGHCCVKFSSAPFENNLFANHNDYDKGLALILKDEKHVYKIFIDFHDINTISYKHYDWADVYAKINLSESDFVQYKKTMPIGPSFAINIDHRIFMKMFLKLLLNKNRPVSILKYINDYVYLLIRRKKYKQYIGYKSDNDYIFSINTLWYDKLTANTTNKFRGEFMHICNRLFSKFEGGFFYINSQQVLKEYPPYAKYLEEYKNILYSKRIKPKEYIVKTKKSTIVFNTPSVGGCHGWKLGEYFAMGKVIISTPLNNIMPATNTIQYNTIPIVFVEDIKNLEDTIIKLKDDDNLRTRLEKESFSYFQKHLSPVAVIESIIGKLNETLMT